MVLLHCHVVGVMQTRGELVGHAHQHAGGELHVGEVVGILATEALQNPALSHITEQTTIEVFYARFIGQKLLASVRKVGVVEIPSPFQQVIMRGWYATVQ